MARPPLRARQRIQALIAKHEPAMQQAFMASVENLTSNLEVGRIVRMLERQDITGALQSLNIDESAFRPFDKAIAEAFEASGRARTNALPKIKQADGSTATIRFDVRHPTADAWLRTHSSELITGIVQDQKMAIREVLAEGIAAGRAPRTTALNIVGRLSRATGRREGGIIGLTGQQERYVASMRARLASGDVDEMRKVLSMERRDKRFDRAIMSAISQGKKLDAEAITRMTGRYADRLLLLRGETIARTETMGALNQGQIESMNQLIGKGLVNRDVVVKVWHSVGDNKVRHTHHALNRKSVGIDQSFVSPSGALIAYPGDPKAPAAERVCCRCWMETKIDFFADLD